MRRAFCAARFAPRVRGKTQGAGPRTQNAFTLVEVMVAVAVLALGVVLIYQSFFVSLDAISYCVDYLSAAPWINEKLWEAKDSLRRLGPSAGIETSGSFALNNRNFTWNLSYQLSDEAGGLYKIDLAVLWHSGRRQAQAVRSAYAMYMKNE